MLIKEHKILKNHILFIRMNQKSKKSDSICQTKKQ